MDLVALLVGLGSIGKTHLSYLTKNYRIIHVVDNNQEVFKNLTPELAKIKCYTNIEEFLSRSVTPDLVVIANWGPDHFYYFQIFEELGVKKFIIEKPLVSKFQDLEKIKTSREENDLTIYMNTPWVYSTIKTQIIELQQKYNLGKICNLSTVGGAKCLVTNGIHYLALAIDLFGESPKYISGKCQSQSINPRSRDFVFLEGNFMFEFSDFKFLNINFSNSSKMQAQLMITFENGYGVLEGDRLSVRVNNSAQPEQDTSPTKTYYPRDLVYDKNPFIDNDDKDGIHEIYRRLSKVAESDGFENALSTMKSIFIALISNEIGSTPIEVQNFVINKEFASRNWMIT